MGFPPSSPEVSVRREDVASNVDSFDATRLNGTALHVPNHLTQAILVTIFCCLPAGIVSIVYAARVNGKVTVGDTAGAREASQNATGPPERGRFFQSN